MKSRISRNPEYSGTSSTPASALLSVLWNNSSDLGLLKFSLEREKLTNAALCPLDSRVWNNSSDPALLEGEKLTLQVFSKEKHTCLGFKCQTLRP